MSVPLETPRRIIAVALGAALLSAPVGADQPATTPHIGLLLPPVSSSPQEGGLREGLHELGRCWGPATIASSTLRCAPPGAAQSMVLVSADHFFLAHKPEIAASVRKARVPACFPDKEYYDERVLMSYGTNRKEAGCKLAVYVDRILKGAKPSELPIEEMSKYELVIDLRVARELGVKVPQALLQRADEVIRW